MCITTLVQSSKTKVPETVFRTRLGNLMLGEKANVINR